MNEWAVGQGAYEPYGIYYAARGGYDGSPPEYRPLSDGRTDSTPSAPRAPAPEAMAAEWTADVLSGVVSGVVVAILAPIVYRALVKRGNR